MLDTQEGDAKSFLMLSEMNFGELPMVNHEARIVARAYGDPAAVIAAHGLRREKTFARRSGRSRPRHRRARRSGLG